MTHANIFWENKLRKEVPEKLGEFIAFLTEMNGTLYLLGTGGESAYYWALRH